ncbi:Anaphase-promoting complex subunit 5-like [Homarus americanus]|uniref:Anaphase-promoting complex subunit 5 n=1 Tax=Homarus americanus TaxID=6706 RepID=A0A8J5MR18_HOMAM|nr:Anaphase-promoting complex subunit 5-like [Homarus americanus]
MIGQSVAPLYGGSNRRERDVVTPHNISILLFIEKYARLRPKYWEHRPSDSSISHPDITPQERKATCLMTVRLVQGGDMVLSELLQVLESAPLLPHHITSFMTALHQMYCSGIDSLLNLFDSVEKFAIQDQPRTETFPCLWTSVVGLYLRRLNLSFRRLSFSQVTSLYQRFRHYYEECYASHSSHLQQSADIQMTAEESNIADDTDSDAKMEDMMEETREDDNGTDLTLCSAEVMAINSSDVGESSVQPPLLLLPQTHPRDMEPTSSQAGHSTRQQAELFISQQTSLLQFSETAALSPPDLQEKIRQLVRQNPDLAEAHYLSYLNCVRVKEFSGAVHSLLRTYDGHLMQRDSGRMEDQGRGFRYAALNLAALHAQFGHKKAGLAVLKEAIRLAQESSDHVCLQHALAWLYTLSPTHKHSLVSLQHGAWALRAALWANWGVSTMTSLASQLLLHLNTHHPTNPTTFYSAQPTCAAICNIAMGLANLGEYQLAGEVLQHAQERFPAHGQHSHTWMFAHAHITLTDLLHQGRWTEAQIVITNMATSHPTEAKLRQCELLVAKGELTEAWELLGELQKDPEVVGELRVRLLLVESCAAVAGGGNAVAVPLLVEGITTAHEHHLTYLAALTHLHLANVQLQLGLHKEAEVSVAGGLGVILAGGSVYDQARARLVAAKLQVSKAKGKDRIGKLLETAVSLELVRKLFMKVRAYQKVRETLYFKARLYHEVGYIEERNKCALEFRQFELQQPCQSYQLSINSF